MRTCRCWQGRDSAGCSNTSARPATRYAGINYLSTLAYQAPYFALPVIVLVNVDSTINSSFYVAWGIVAIAFYVPSAIGQALLAEGGKDGAQLRSQLRLALALAVALGVGEPADLDASNVSIQLRPSYVLVAKSLISDEADIGFFLAETFDELSEVVRKQLRVLVRSQIYVISHVFLMHPRVASKFDAFRNALLAMDKDVKGQMALEDVGISKWETVEQEDVEFMIDLMVALTA